MAKVKFNPNRLLVEGADEQRVIPYLLDQHVVWGDDANQWVVAIDQLDGSENLLKPGLIEVESKVSGLRALGVIVDADNAFESQWARIRERLLNLTPDVPEQLPRGGLILEIDDGPRIGVWIMPDNCNSGMLETFLAYLVVPERAPLWEFAQEACAGSKDHDAPYKEVHRPKANVHTYLSWLDPPGMSLHLAVLSRAFDSHLPLANMFVQWFVELFQLNRRDGPSP